MNQDLELVDFLPILIKHKRVAAAIMAASITASVLAAVYLPKTYKATSVITISPNYFRYSYVHDFVPEMVGFEIATERQNLVSGVLTNEFITVLGESLKIFKSQRESTRRRTEAEDLLKNIEIVSLGSGIRVSFSAGTSDTAYLGLKKIISQIEPPLQVNRKKKLLEYRGALERKIQSVVLVHPESPTGDPITASQPEIIKGEITRLESEAAVLAKQYSELHPAYQDVLSRVTAMKLWLAKAQQLAAQSSKSESKESGKDLNGFVPGAEPLKVSLVVYESLVLKLNYLNMELDMDKAREESYVSIIEEPRIPSAPIKPSKNLILGGGIMAGILMSAFVVRVREYSKRGAPTAEQFSAQLGVPYLGAMPSFQWTEGPRRRKES